MIPRVLPTRARTVLPGLAIVALLPLALAAQQIDPSTRVPAPAPEDVATIDGIMAAVYGAISGPAGQPRDWRRFRSVMHPDARLIPTGPRPGGGASATILSVDDYVERAGPSLERDGFFEREIGRRTDRYGNVVHLMSAYESLRSPEAEPFARGVNSFQLFRDGDRWWVMTIFWEQESEANPIPPTWIGGRN